MPFSLLVYVSFIYIFYGAGSVKQASYCFTKFSTSRFHRVPVSSFIGFCMWGYCLAETDTEKAPLFWYFVFGVFLRLLSKPYVLGPLNFSFFAAYNLLPYKQVTNLW